MDTPISSPSASHAPLSDPGARSSPAGKIEALSKPILFVCPLLFAAILASASLSAAKEPARPPVPVIFDTDMMGDVDDVGATAVLHALARRGEAKILAMGVCVGDPATPLCLDALNTYYFRGDIPIGVVKGAAFVEPSKYTGKIALEFPHRLKSAAEAPDVVALYRKTLAAQADQSVVVVTVGMLTNLRNLLRSGGDASSPLDGTALVKKKVRAWVCMGGTFPKGREYNLYSDAPASVEVAKRWPTPAVFSGFEIGDEIMTGGKLRGSPASSPVRRAFELFNGLQNRQSWDETAVFYAVRGLNGGLADYWDLRRGRIEVAQDGSNAWRDSPSGPHQYLVKKLPPQKVAEAIEALMLERPRRPGDADWKANATIEEMRTATDVQLGAAQGVSYRQNHLYFYGDVYQARPRVGIIREYTLDLKPTGRDIRLARHGRTVIQHPTGLAWDARFGCFLGDTVNKVATIYKLDWDRALLADGNLDSAVLAEIHDDAAVNGCRPEYVTWKGRRLLATADYGDVRPAVRLYDPARLVEAGHSSAQGVCVATIPCGPFNQNLFWDQAAGELTCVQNVVAGLGWKLDVFNLEKAVAGGKLEKARVRTLIFKPHSELEGWIRQPDGREVFVTSSSKNNIFVGKSKPSAAFSTPAGTYD
jgi:hypothetical protein